MACLETYTHLLLLMLSAKAMPNKCNRVYLQLPSRSLLYAKVTQGERNQACLRLPSRNLLYAKVHIISNPQKTVFIKNNKEIAHLETYAYFCIRIAPALHYPYNNNANIFL